MLEPLLWLTLLGASDAPTTLPTDVSGYGRGAEAVFFDPGAAGLADGFELHLRARLAADELGVQRGGVALAWPLAGVTPFAGFEWRHVPGARHRLGTIGLALVPDEQLSLGVAWRRYLSSRAGYADASAVDVGLAAEVSSWLTLSGGVVWADGGVEAPRGTTARIGAMLRPLGGAPWLQLGGDTGWSFGEQELAASRVLLDLGLEGVHAQVAYEPRAERLWFGAAISLFGSTLQLATAPSLDGGGAALGDSTVALTMRAAPSESLVWPSGRTVEVQVHGDLRSSPPRPWLGRPPLATLAVELTALARDSSVATVVLEIGELEVGLASVEELRQAIQALRGAGKTVIAEIANVDDKAYLVAAAADRIRLDPAGVVQLDGFAVRMLYVAEALAKLGVRVEAVEIGRYKTAPDVFTRNAPRPEELEVKREVLAEAMALLRAALRERGLAVDEIAAVLGEGVFTAERALAHRLVDELSQPTDPAALPQVRESGQSLASLARPRPVWGAPARVALIPVVGTIVIERGDNPLPGESAEATRVVRELEAALRDPTVVAAVVRVDSGGGDVYASEVIWRAVRQLAEHKPVVASLGDAAASGGYYVAVGAPFIVAEPNTLTGSIGIFTLRPDASALLERIGVHVETVKEGERADWDSWTRPLDQAERERVTRVLGDYYETVLGRVAHGRRRPIDELRPLAEGRVYTGQAALRLGLVDAVGGLAAAIAEAAARAGYDPDAVEVTQPETSLSLAAAWENVAAAPAHPLAALAELRRRVVAWEGRPLALWPFSFAVGR